MSGRLRHRSAIVVVAVLVLVLQLAGATSARAQVRIMVLGDSISQGFEGDFTWRYRLKQHLTAAGVATDFVGPWSGTNALPDAVVDGAPPRFDGAYRSGVAFADSQHMARWGWQLHQARWDVAPEVKLRLPDVLIVALGFNDLGWGVSSPAGAVADLKELVANARVAKPGVKVAVVNVAQRSSLDNLPDLPAKIAEYDRQLAAAMPGLSQPGSPAVLVDVASALNASADTYDGLHPNVRGEYVIAKQVADRLASGLGLGRAYGSVPASVPADLQPATPSPVTVTRVGTALKASWPRSFGATGYRLYRRDVTAGEADAKPYPYAVGAQSWTEQVLPAGHRIEFSIQALRGDRAGARSAPGAATVKPLPAVPDLKATSSEARPYTATLSWGAVPEADDYAVYAAYQSSGECLNGIGPRPEQMQLVQWGLGSKTSWTQEYLIDVRCVHYRVVAMRYGGEGAHAAGYAVATAFPFANNAWHWQARAKFWAGSVWPGDRRVVTNVGSGPDRGIVLARAFIQNTPDVEGFTVSDRRSYATDPLASSRVTVAWDTGSGDVSVYVQQSCFLEGCLAADPISLVAGAASIADSTRDYVNYLTVRRNGNGLEIETSAVISLSKLSPPRLPPIPRINARVSLVPSGSSYSARIVGDKFPSWEILRYPTNVWAGIAPYGDSRTIGTRTQTNPLDLFGPATTCSSPAGEDVGVPRPMAC